MGSLVVLNLIRSDIFRKNIHHTLRIQSEYRKIRTRKTPYLDTFHAVIEFWQGFEYASKLNLHIGKILMKALWSDQS